MITNAELQGFVVKLFGDLLTQPETIYNMDSVGDSVRAVLVGQLSPAEFAILARLAANEPFELEMKPVVGVQP